MISKELDLIFLHMPRAAGSSIQEVLIKMYFRAWTSFAKRGYRGFEYHYEKYSFPIFQNLRDMEISKNEAKAYTIFYVLRNPIERIASTHYRFFEESLLNEDMLSTDFKTYLQNIKKYFNNEFNDIRDNKVFDQNGKIILDVYSIEKLSWWTETIDGSEAACKILNFDNIAKEWDKFKKSIGPPGFMKYNPENRNPTNSLSIVRNNTSGNSNYFDYYDEEDLETIYEIYGEEIGLYKDME